MKMETEKPMSKANVLSSILLRAWRERWTDSQWGINMKTVLPRGVSGDTYNLADSLLQQAVIGSDANKLILSYLRHSLCSRQVSHTAVIKRIAKFDGFDKFYCLNALLEFLEAIINGVTCRTKEEENSLPNVMLSLLHWMTKIFATILDLHYVKESVEAPQLKALNLLIKLLNKIADNPFLVGIFGIAKDEDVDQFRRIQKKIADAKNVLSNANVQHLSQAKELIELFGKIIQKDATKDTATKEAAEPITYCMQPLIAVSMQRNPCKSTDSFTSQFLIIKQLKNYNLSRFYYEIIRGAMISLNNVSGTNRETTWCAFAYIKVPQILQKLHLIHSIETGQSDQSQEIAEAIEMLLDDQILDALDTKYACNTIEFLLGELVKLNLLNEQQGQKFSTAREPIALSLSKIELPPPIIKMVKQASTPLAGILKALDCDYNKIQESLLEILAKALNGNSFELILSVASIEGKLKTFVSRLIRCNEGSKQVAGETDKAAASRAALFDISFLMLTFIVQNYGVEAVLSEKGDSFFEKWVRECMIERNKNKSALKMVQQCDQSKIDDFMSNLDPEKSKSQLTMKWQDACMSVPAVLYHLLLAWENKTISATEVKTYLDNMKSRLCSFSVCAASWLCAHMQMVRHDELTKPTSMIKDLLAHVNGDDINRQDSFKERFNLSTQIVRKMHNDIQQNQKVRTNGPSVISQQPLEEQFVETWKTITERGWLTIESAHIFDNLLHSCGPFWLVSKMVNEILQCKFAKDMRKLADIVFAVMHLNIEKCTAALLSDLLPMLLINKTQKFELIEPQLSVLTRLCVYCISSSLEKQSTQKKRTLSTDAVDSRATKMRKLDESNASVGIFSTTEQSTAITNFTEKLPEPIQSSLVYLFKMFIIITASDELTPKLFFVHKFFELLQKCKRERVMPVFHLLPPGLTQNLMKTLNVNAHSYEFILKMYDLKSENGRKGAMADLILLRAFQMQNNEPIN